MRFKFRSLGCFLFAGLVSSLGLALAQGQLPPELDADQDGLYDQLEMALGSDANNLQSTPESHSFPDRDNTGVADVCEDLIDNDGDGLTDEADPGCKPLEVSASLEAGLDIFSTKAKIYPGGLRPGIPPIELNFAGPAVVRKGDPDDGVSVIQMEALQLWQDSGNFILLADPDSPSTGTVTLEGDGSSRFQVNTILVSDGNILAREGAELVNDFIPHLPPVQDSRKVDRSKCYKWPGGEHCPQVPRLRTPVLKWVAKFDCGQQPSTPPLFLGPVTPGEYATKIVIHNPHGEPVKLKKKVSDSLRNPWPPDEKQFGQISAPQSVELPAHASIDVDCCDIYRLLQIIPPQVCQTGQKAEEPMPFRNGVVTILSTKKLDVIANYTQEVPKEKVEFRIDKQKRWRKEKLPDNLNRLIGRRLKIVTLVTEDVIVDPEQEVRKALRHKFPNSATLIDNLKITILSDDIGVGSSMDVEKIWPQDCVLVDPPDLPEGKLECKNPFEKP